jgi:hypothetical protein
LKWIRGIRLSFIRCGGLGISMWRSEELEIRN